MISSSGAWLGVVGVVTLASLVPVLVNCEHAVFGLPDGERHLSRFDVCDLTEFMGSRPGSDRISVSTGNDMGGDTGLGREAIAA